MAKLIAGVFLILLLAGLWMGMGGSIDKAVDWRNRYLEAERKIAFLEDKKNEFQSLLDEKSKALLETDERYQTLAREAKEKAVLLEAKAKELQSLLGEKSEALLEAKERLASLEDRFKAEIAALASTYELEKVKSYDLAEKVKSLELSLDDQKQALRNVYR